MPSFFKKLLLLVTGALGLGATAAGKTRRADRAAKQGEPADSADSGTTQPERNPERADVDPSTATPPLKPNKKEPEAGSSAFQGGGASGPVAGAAPEKPLAKEVAASTEDAVMKPGIGANATELSSAKSLPDSAAEPRRLDGPRDGSPDNLTRIKGIGPAIERLLFEHGIYHFDQIAGWGAAESRWIEQMVGFAGRVGREGWIEQAREFAGDQITMK